MENLICLIDSESRLTLGVIGNMLQNCSNRQEILKQINKDFLRKIVNFIKVK